jgi:hypothetical protein
MATFVQDFCEIGKTKDLDTQKPGASCPTSQVGRIRGIAAVFDDAGVDAEDLKVGEQCERDARLGYELLRDRQGDEAPWLTAIDCRVPPHAIYEDVKLWFLGRPPCCSSSQ